MLLAVAAANASPLYGLALAFAFGIGRGLPFLIATGYDRDVLPDDLKMVVRLEKPFRTHELISAAAGVFESAKAGGREAV